MKKLIAAVFIIVVLAGGIFYFGFMPERRAPWSEPSQTQLLTVAEVQDLALTHVGSGQIQEVNLVGDVYQVTVDAEDLQFLVRVDAHNGQILGLESVALAEEQTPMAVAPTPELTITDAINVALANLQAEGNGHAQLESAELDTRGGQEIWQVEFEDETSDFEFEIDAGTGDILKAWTSSSHDFQEATATVNHESAIEKALVLVPNGRAVEIDKNNERSVWEVTIKDGRTEHEIQIDWETGDVRAHEIDD